MALRPVTAGLPSGHRISKEEIKRQIMTTRDKEKVAQDQLVMATLENYKREQIANLEKRIEYLEEADKTEVPDLENLFLAIAENCKQLAKNYSRAIKALADQDFKTDSQLEEIISRYSDLITLQEIYVKDLKEGLPKNQEKEELIIALTEEIQQQIAKDHLDNLPEFASPSGLITPLDLSPMCPLSGRSLLFIEETEELGTYASLPTPETEFIPQVLEFEAAINQMVCNYLQNPTQLIAFIESQNFFFHSDIDFSEHWTSRNDIYSQLSNSSKVTIASTKKCYFEPDTESIIELIEKKAMIFPEHDNTETFIIGDLHGDPISLYTILSKENLLKRLQNEDVRIIFTGDLVDRGSESLEVLLIILQLKTMFPDKIFLTKGNHEIKNMVDRGEFQTEIRQRFCSYPPVIAEKIINTFKSLFSELPYFGIYDDILILHGGIPVYNATFEPTTVIGSEVPCSLHGFLASAHDYSSILWGDPNPDIVRFAKNPTRGDGIYCFNPHKIIEELALKLGIKKIVRGHTVQTQPGDPKADVVIIHSTGGKSIKSWYQDECPRPFYGVIEGGHADLRASERPFFLREIYT